MHWDNNYNSPIRYLWPSCSEYAPEVKECRPRERPSRGLDAIGCSKAKSCHPTQEKQLAPCMFFKRVLYLAEVEGKLTLNRLAKQELLPDLHLVVTNLREMPRQAVWTGWILICTRPVGRSFESADGADVLADPVDSGWFRLIWSEWDMKRSFGTLQGSLKESRPPPHPEKLQNQMDFQ